MKTVELISKEVRVDNSDNAGRQYDVKAVATVRDGNVTDIREGAVRNEGGVVVATFYGNNGNLNTSFSTGNRAEVLAAIDEFVADLNDNAATL